MPDRFSQYTRMQSIFRTIVCMILVACAAAPASAWDTRLKLRNFTRSQVVVTFNCGMERTHCFPIILRARQSDAIMDKPIAGFSAKIGSGTCSPRTTNFSFANGRDQSWEIDDDPCRIIRVF
jgi:hypothetical protein